MGSSDELASLLAEVSRLYERAAAAAQEGRLEEMVALQQHAASVAERAAALNRQTGERKGGSPAAARYAPSPRTRGEGASARAHVITALTEIGVPAPPRLVVEYALARFGARLDSRLFASLRRDEWKAWSSPRAARPQYVVPALEGGRFLPIRGKVALSEWPLERRIIGPWSERVDHLTTTLHLLRQARWLLSIDVTAAQLLAPLVDRMALSVAGVPDGGATHDPARAEAALRAELAQLQPQDREWREAAAHRARQVLAEEHLLWGAPLPRMLGGEGE